MTQTIAHFVFTGSGAGCLVQALRKAGRDDLVVATCHDMNLDRSVRSVVAREMA
jgi:hypothetical protein